MRASPSGVVPMKRLVLLLCFCAVPSLAGELEGVKMPDDVLVEGHALKLNGMGLRKKFIINVYVAGLYVEHPNKDASAILGTDETRRVDMVMLRDLDAATIVEAIRTGFDKNAKAQLPGLQERLDAFCKIVPNVKKGQTLTISYVPGKGTSIAGAGGATMITGKDFADALFSVWIGKEPVDDTLKKGMLGAS
jgi:hypothetical protein